MFLWRLGAGLWMSGSIATCLATCLAASAAAAAVTEATSPALERTFDIEAYDVDGAKLLQQVDIERAVYPFLGPGRTRADVDKARAALEKAYHDRGYQSVVVDVPPQSVSDNIVRLHVVEAPVGRLRVTGARYHSPEIIRREAAAFKEGEVPDIAQAQKELTELNRLPDRRVTPLLHAGQIPGTVDVDLKVADTLPLHASVEVDNDHSQNTEPLRLNATVHYDNLWQLGHSLSFTYSVAPQRPGDSTIFAASYLAPIWNTPWSVLVYGYHSNSDVATLGGTNVLGKGYAIGVRGVLQLPRVADLSQSLSFGVDMKDFDENIDFSTSTTTDTIQYFPLVAAWNLQHDGARTSTKVSVSLTAGMRGVGSNTSDFENKRATAAANFVHVNLDVTQTEALGHGFEAVQRLSGQMADGPLVSSEQFSAGGVSSVRGYLQSEEVGDDGFSGALEIRSPSVASRLGAYVDELRVYAFGDGAVLHVISPLPDQTDFYSLASAGVGVRLGLLKYLKGDAVLAVPLMQGVATHRFAPRATFTVKSEF